MAQTVPVTGSRDADVAAIRTSTSRGTAVGELAADHATDLYVEQERLTRRERFDRMIRKAAAIFQ